MGLQRSDFMGRQVVPSAKDKARLTVARNDARRQLVERIEKAGDINADDVRSYPDLEQAEEKEKRWREFNSALLSRLFTSEEYAREYDSAVRPVHVISDRYFDPSLDDIAQRLVRTVKSQISSLRSIIDRLDLVDEGAMPVAAIEDAMQAERNLQLLIERFHLVAQQLRVRHDSRPTLDRPQLASRRTAIRRSISANHSANSALACWTLVPAGLQKMASQPGP